MSDSNVLVDERSPVAVPRVGLGHARMGHGLAGRDNSIHEHGKMIRRAGAAPKPKSFLRRDAVPSTSCLSGALYTWPQSGSNIPTSNKTTIAWDPDCLPNHDHIDIYFYAQGSGLPVQTWRSIPTANRQYTDQIYPEWWNKNGTSGTTSLNINIVPSGNQPWDSSNPLGPFFNVQYDSNTPTQPQDKIDSLISVFLAGGSLTPGGKAAAIICPLVVLFVALGVWIRKLHINRNNKTADWADHLDKRMSRISLDWQRGGDGSAGPVPGSRPASFYVGSQQSHGNFAGRGAGNVPASPALGRGTDGWEHSVDHTYGGAYESDMMEQPPQRGFSTYDEGNRQSRISFAQSTAGDRVSRISYAGQSSADHSKNSMTIPRLGQHGWRRSAVTTDSYYDPDAPAVPKLSSQYARPESQMRLSAAYADTTDDLMMSPSQSNGPAQLGHAQVDQMRDSLSADRAQNGDDQADHEFRESVSKYPALSFLAEGRNDENDGGDIFRDTPEPTESRGEHGAPIEGSSSPSYFNQGNYNQAGAHALAPEHPMHYGSSPSPSPAVSSQTGMMPPVNATSPDDAMKQYAALRAVAGSPLTPGGGANVMRTLYTPELSAPAHPNNNGHGHRPSMNSVAGSSLNEDDVVGYNEMLS